MSNNAHDLSKRLLNALDSNYNVVDMQTVNEIISILEKINITKELLETTRLGKHVNELRRKTNDPTLARRAKVLVKRWRDLVIPTAATASPAHLGSNRSSAERQTRRLGGTPLTSPALMRHVVSPAVQSPLPPARPTWGGYESDSQDVILVDDDPDPPPPPPSLSTPAIAALTPPKRPTSPAVSSEDKKSKRDKKPKKKRGRGRAGSGSEVPAEWSGRNGSSAASQNVTTAHETTAHVTTAHGTAAHVTTAHSTTAPGTTAHGTVPHKTPHVGRPRKNGCKTSVDAYTALVHKMPRAGGKKVKTTVELLSEIQSRGSAAVASPTPASPASPDVMLIEAEMSPVRVDSPLRNGGIEPKEPTPPPTPLPPLEDPRPYHECTCNEEFADEDCPAASNYPTAPLHVRALHQAYLPGINGTRAPPHPHQFAVRKPENEDYPGLFASVVPLYKYSDYADDYCVKNMSRVPLCTHLKWTEFAPAPPSPPPFKTHPTPRPYPIEDLEEPVTVKLEIKEDSPEAMDVDFESSISSYICPKIEAEMVSVPVLEPSERLKAPLLSSEEKSLVIKCETKESTVKVISEVEKSDFTSNETDHRTVERTKVSEMSEKSDLDGRTLYEMCAKAKDSILYDYSQTSSTPVVTLPLDDCEATVVLDEALESAKDSTELDDFGKPARSANFTEWHECAKLGDLIALPYVVID